MKNKSWIKKIVLFSALVVAVTINSVNIFAVEGGEAPVQGEITFIGDSSSEPRPSSSSEPKSSETGSDTPKPKGRFPSTGEMVKTGVSVGGLLLVLIAIFLFTKKTKSSKEGD